MAYTKLFDELLTSSLWMEDDQTVRVWVTMLAKANQHGEVMASVPGLAHIANVPREDTERSLAILSSPDPDSRSPECEGRRIEKIDGGWRLINHAKYRAKQSAEDKREKDRDRKRKARARADDCGQVRTSAECSEGVRDRPKMSAMSAHTDTDTDTDTDTEADTEEGKISGADAPSSSGDDVSVPVNGSRPDPVPYEQILEEWNELAKANDLPTIDHIDNPTRRKGVAARWKNKRHREQWTSGKIAEQIENRNQWARDERFPKFNSLWCSPTNWDNLVEGNHREKESHSLDGDPSLPF